jgi:hypothetical protein
MDDFEDDLKIALTRLKRAELKESLQAHEEESFEEDISEALKRQERAKLKAQLVAHVGELDILDEKLPFSFLRYWKYSAAACIIIGTGLFFYNLNENNKVGKMAEIKQPKIETPKTNENIKQEETTKEEDQIFNSKVFAEDIGQLGFGSKPFDLKVVVNKANKGLKYRFRQNSIVFKSSKKIDVNIYKVHDQFYFKVNQKVYLLKNNTSFEAPKEVLDKEILDLLP